MSAPLFDGLDAAGRKHAADEHIVRVALPLPLDRLFDYRVDLPGSSREASQKGVDGAAAAIATEAIAPLLGRRVRVTFSGQVLVGLIVPSDLEDGEPTEPHADDPKSVARGHSLGVHELATIDALIDEEPVVSESMIRLLADAAREIFCPVGLAVAHALPPGSTPRTARPYALTPRGQRALAHGALSRESLGGDARPILQLLAERPLTLAGLIRAMPRVPMMKRLESLSRDGLIERRTEIRSAKARVPMERLVRLAPGVDPVETVDTILARAGKQAALLTRIAAIPSGITTRALTAADANAGAALRALAKRDLLLFEERPRLSQFDDFLDGGERVALTDDQTDALVPLRDAIKRQVAETFLLHGVTGSGKTEVYLQAIEEALRAERQALVLVPEITLTHQLVARVRARFGDEVAILHSGLKPGDRLAQWERLRTGQTAIAVGARSALFAPLESLGLIVIDEEHDGAYKNDEGFRYHARELAQRRAREASCPLILGSATPSLETRYLADTGQIRRLSLPRRVGGRPLPAVEIVDLAKEKDKNPLGRKLVLSRPMRRAIEQTMKDGGQTILFLNRRGFSTRIFCFQCGHAERCNDCDVALVFHASDHHLRCHYCDHVRAVPEECGGCGDPETALLGVGTERLEEEVSTTFPEARVMRLDRDAASKRGYVESVLRAIKEREVDIVIGTQMVAKGHDFPGVQLVGVVAADIGLHLPDFRAAERSFQLITQVAGRAGRANRPGRVVVQTFVPDHYALRPVETHDYEGFYAEEIQYRETLGYPPFGTLTRVVVSAEDEKLAHEATETLAKAARAELPDAQVERVGIEVLGPAPAPLAKLRGRFRFMILLKGGLREGDQALLRRISRRVLDVSRRQGKGVQVALDARPINML